MPIDHSAASSGEFAQSAWASARISKRLDSEMAALLRMQLHGVFTSSRCWDELTSELRNRGYYLQPADARLWLSDSHSHVRICSCSFLGFPSNQLETRFGARLQ